MAKTARIFATIDVNYFEDDRVLEAGDAWQLHFAAILACKRGMTNGDLTRRQLARIAPESLGDIGRAIDDLIRVGLFIDNGDAITIHGWTDWNESTEDIEAMAKGGEYGNHLRWHIRRNLIKAGCSFCSDRGESGGDIPPESGPESQIRSDADEDPDENEDDFSVSDESHARAEIESLSEHLSRDRRSGIMDPAVSAWPWTR
jgi:hypothetical protein